MNCWLNLIVICNLLKLLTWVYNGAACSHVWVKQSLFTPLYFDCSIFKTHNIWRSPKFQRYCIVPICQTHAAWKSFIASFTSCISIRTHVSIIHAYIKLMTKIRYCHVEQNIAFMFILENGKYFLSFFIFFPPLRDLQESIHTYKVTTNMQWLSIQAWSREL